jgi:serine/threonine-protein kinase RsbW
MNKKNNRQTLALQNNMAELEKLHKFLIEFTAANDIPAQTYDDLRLVVEESFANIIDHAYTDNKSHIITVELDTTDNTIIVSFTDDGIAFNPLTKCNEIHERADHSEGGMGMHIIKSLTDSQQYRRINQHNVFTLTKLYTKKKQ